MSNRSQQWHGTTLVNDIAWGDNGKGRIIDYLASDADLVIRWAGGPNAGHTVNNERGEFKFHLMPSGIFEATCILADTVAVDPDILIAEMDSLQKRGVTVSEKNLMISPDITMILDWHKRRDNLNEVARGGSAIGTTGKGMGPLYADRAERTGIQIHHLYSSDFEERLLREFTWQTRLARLMGGERLLSELSANEFAHMSREQFMKMAKKALSDSPYDFEDMLQRLYRARDRFKPMVCDVIPVIWDAFDNGKNILGEGAQGALLDIDLGTTPFVTSSHPTRGGFSIATGIYDIDNVYGATRAYTARVGGGPFPTELTDSIGDHLVEVGKEYGTTTGRRRRCGWFDAVISRFGARIAGATEVAITKLDVLDELDEVKICTGYEVGRTHYGVGQIPSVKPRFLSQAKPVYETMAGWQEPTSGARSFEDLPDDAQKYVLRIQELLDTNVKFVSVGPQREEMFSM